MPLLLWSSVKFVLTGWKGGPRCNTVSGRRFRNGTNRLSRDQKRKEKLKIRASRLPQPVSLVYYGSKYRRPELLGGFLETEWAIHDSDVMAKQSMIDADVEHALEFLIEELRRGAKSRSTNCSETCQYSLWTQFWIAGKSCLNIACSRNVTT